MFEAGSDGIIFWVNGAPRGALVGLDIGRTALANEPGVDGNAAGAFRQRGEISNARLLLEGGAAVAGEWRFSAIPWFDKVTGQFRGYRGHARRPHQHETAHAVSATEGAGDSIRQLIHELRSPLNAISGFAQIVESQMFGPVNQNYRAMAATIVADAANLQSIIEDLDSAARAEQAPAPRDPATSADLIMTMNLVARDLTALARERGVTVRVPEIAAGQRVAIAEPACRRIIGRLLTALVDIAAPGEILSLIITSAGDRLSMSINRPVNIAHSREADLLDPGFSPTGDAPAASVLSLGFSLRLVASLARQNGGGLDFGVDRLTLSLPSATPVTNATADRLTGD
jgi:signal transduction histidine kinase